MIKCDRCNKEITTDYYRDLFWKVNFHSKECALKFMDIIEWDKGVEEGEIVLIKLGEDNG